MAPPDRLRRYGSKDYSQRVSFPVEIVGRDQQVRRYPFEGAVGLYRRRVLTAATRYGDPETVAAEIHHCRSRIEQLRRSYLYDAGIRPASGDGVMASPLAADVLSFLRTALGVDAADAALAAASPLAGGAGETWWLPAPGGGGQVLYAFRLDGEAPSGARVELERTLQRLDAARGEQGAERLLVGKVDGDLGVLLAGTESWQGATGMLPDAAEAEEPGASADVHQRALGAFRHGQLAGALRHFEDALQSGPPLAPVARAAAVVGLLADEPERAEFAARHGLLLQPHEPHLTYLLALALFRRGLDEEARRVVADRGPLADLLGSLDALAGGRVLAAWRLSRASGRQASPEWFVRPAARAAALLAGSLAVARACALAAVLLGGFVFVNEGQGLGLAAAVASMVALAIGEVRTRRIARRALRGGRFGRILLCPPELLPADLPARPAGG